MNPGVFSLRYDRIIFAAMALVLAGGVVAYRDLGRLEDPEFTIKDALIITPYPGASAEEVALEVSNPIESACQQLGQLKRVESQSMRGLSIVSASIKDRYDRDKIPQVWDELRRKVHDAQSRLPPSVRGRSVVQDDFGDVYGIFLAITGEGYSYPELRRYAEFLRRELLPVDHVQKVELFGEQQEQAFLEISRPRLARFGITEDQIYALLTAKNIAADGGRVRVGGEHLALDPAGGFRSPSDMLDIVIGSDQSGRQLVLGDVAEIVRGYSDPPRRILRFDGNPAIGIGISTVLGGNVVRLGEGVRQKLAELKVDQPIGIEIGEINFQPEAVTEATNDFMFNLLKAVTIVIVVLLFTMGRKTGLIIGAVLFLTIMATFVVMFLKGDLLMERISLGALIIALCMLTDNAIIVIEGVKVGIESGGDKVEVVRDVIAQNQWPLFGATAIGILAFAAIGWSEDRTGEYVNSLFWVILISLSLSWVSSVTATPLLGSVFFRRVGDASAAPADPYGGIVFRAYRSLLATALRLRYLVLVVMAAAFVASIYGFTKIDQSFFPPATRPQFMVDVFLPAGTHIRESEAFAGVVEQFLQKQDGVTHVTTFVGGGGLRFLLVYSPELENRSYVQFLVDVEDEDKIDAVLEAAQNHLDTQYPDANTIAKKFLLGPGDGGRIQARFRGRDPLMLREIAEKAKAILDADGHAKGVRHNWREREKVIRPTLFEMQTRRNGLTRVDVSELIETSFEGRVVGFYRDPGFAGSGGGTYPQETRLLPIVARPPFDERSDVTVLENLQIFSPVAGRKIPLAQVVSGVEVATEDPVIMRRDRFPTITVHADPRSGLPSQLFRRVRPAIEAIELPPGYSLEWGGEYEDSNDARAALAVPLPYFLALMVFIVVCLYNSLRITLLIWLVMPLSIIGVTVGLLTTGHPFGFMALLGVIALGGELIKNQIVVLSKILAEIDKGKSPYQAILDGGTSKMRPVCMVVFTTVLGMIPLLKDPFFGAMAVCIMFGLSFAAFLSLVVTPVLYATIFGITEATPPTPVRTA